MSLNKYINKVERLEFTVTNSSTGKCKHCSEGNLSGDKKLDAEKAVSTIKELALDNKKVYFGGSL
jgi:hypothetical protein